MAVSQPQDKSEHVTSRPRKDNELFMPKDTSDQRCDVILLVEDGKEFKGHKQVLSKASSFFEKLLNSDMKESREGIVRLEMFSESAIRKSIHCSLFTRVMFRYWLKTMPETLSFQLIIFFFRT